MTLGTKRGKGRAGAGGAEAGPGGVMAGAAGRRVPVRTAMCGQAVQVPPARRQAAPARAGDDR